MIFEVDALPLPSRHLQINIAKYSTVSKTLKLLLNILKFTLKYIFKPAYSFSCECSFQQMLNPITFFIVIYEA